MVNLLVETGTNIRKNLLVVVAILLAILAVLFLLEIVHGMILDAAGRSVVEYFGLASASSISC